MGRPDDALRVCRGEAGRSQYPTAATRPSAAPRRRLYGLRAGLHCQSAAPGRAPGSPLRVSDTNPPAAPSPAGGRRSPTCGAILRSGPPPAPPRDRPVTALSGGFGGGAGAGLGGRGSAGSGAARRGAQGRAEAVAFAVGVAVLRDSRARSAPTPARLSPREAAPGPDGCTAMRMQPRLSASAFRALSP